MLKLSCLPVFRDIAVAGWCVAFMLSPAHAQTTNVSASPGGEGTSVVSELDSVTVVGTVGDLQSLDFYAPHSSAVISSQDVEVIGARTLDQALQYQSGIVSEPYGLDNKTDWFQIRGFNASVSLDGAPTTPNGYFVGRPEVFGLESIEVIKGPDSLAYGASEAGGVVNLVTKRPHKTESLEMNLGGGTGSRASLGLDYNGIANEEGNVYYRIVAQARREDGMQYNTRMKSYYLAPSVTFDFSDRTSLTLLTSVQHEDGIPTNGFLPGYGTIIDTPYGTIDRRLNAGEPDFDRFKRTQVTAGWLLRHQFSDDWTFTQNYKFSRMSIDRQDVYAFSSDGDRGLTRFYSYAKGSTRNNYIDNRLSGKIRLGDSVELLPVVGFDYLKSDTSGQNNPYGNAPSLDMFSPVYGKPFAVTSTPYDLNTKQLGVYASTQLRVGSHWNFNAGLRHDSAQGSGMSGGADAGYSASHNSVNVGMMYISDFGVSPYVSYSESFKPQPGVDAYGSAYLPFVGKQKEVGLKLEPGWLDGTVTLAYFDIEQKNALVADASNIQTQSGKRTNKGVELQGDFRIGRSTAVKVAYTYNHSRQDIDGGKTIRTPLIPRNQASLWVSHQLNLPHGSGLTVAAGVRYNGPTEDQHYYSGITIPGYTIFDMMARYQIDRRWALQINARNLTDKTYVSACDFYCYYGSGRVVDAQLQYQWK
ncbi:TonB-dependent siderophore receptor [Castellaniella sp.]|uniref:TonB-dependent siderophore receptor n=1 Tax=Castellaniella sp. TaxID=1955812 RepID=UPI003C781AB1